MARTKVRQRRQLGLLGAIGAVVGAVALVLAPTSASAATNISIVDGGTACSGASFCYSPASASTTTGTQVVWSYSGNTFHTVTRCSIDVCPVNGGTGTDTTFTDSGTISNGGSFSHAFTAPGTYVYYCQFHGYASMHGTVTVSGSGSSTTTSPSTTVAGGKPSVSIGDVAVTEGDAKARTAYFPVTLSKASTQTVTVSYATADGTAHQPGDYAAKSGTLSIAAGAVKGVVAVPVKGDTADETDETFSVNLSAPVNATLGDATGTGTIRDDDPSTGLRLTIGDVAVYEGNAGSQSAKFTVSLSAPSTSTVTVAYATADQTALKPGDYAAKSGTLTFNPGVVSQSVSVAVKSDTVKEPDETFKVVLSAPTGGATITDDTGVGTIRNDD